KLNKEGFSNAVKFDDKGMLRVVLTGYESEEAARADMAIVRATDKLYSGSWLKHF
ncbi:MAG: SPOR domain-containing protein, partial [Paludibacteraceae bacterium]|nr:SPOR domain-containing protein [Paludibacteraceae bacterium]